MKKINILFVHPLTGNTYELYKAFDRNPQVEIFPLIESTDTPKRTMMSKIRHKIKLHQDMYNINKKLLAYDLSKIDIVFVVKGNVILPSTLKKIKNKYPALQLINWSLDDMYAWRNRSIYYTFGLKYYDHVFTTKSYNIAELTSIGANKVHFLYQAYSRDIHNPCIECIENPEYDVVFIGFPENERFESLQYLAHHGIKIDIFGYPLEWRKLPFINYHKNLIMHNHSVYGGEYAQALSSSKISLCFLRKANRDLHTTRSFEIPACGSFMIAERTSEHSNLFTEDQEAVYFNSDKELLKKVNYYLEHNEERKLIAQAGLKRCQTSGYSYDNMIDKILKNLNA